MCTIALRYSGVRLKTVRQVSTPPIIARIAPERANQCHRPLRMLRKTETATHEMPIEHSTQILVKEKWKSALRSGYVIGAFGYGVRVATANSY